MSATNESRMPAMKTDDATFASSVFGVNCVRWLEAQPGWQRLGPKRQEIAVHLALNESDPEEGTLTHRSVREMSERSVGLYTRDQIRDTLKAFRVHGLAYSEQAFVDARHGFGRHQTASKYFLAKDRKHRVSTRRQEAGKRGKERRTAYRPPGRIPFTPAQNRELHRQMRNRRPSKVAGGETT